MLPGEPGGRRFETLEVSAIGAAFELQYQRCAPPPPRCAASAALRWRPPVYVRELSRGPPGDCGNRVVNHRRASRRERAVLGTVGLVSGDAYPPKRRRR